MDKEARIPNPYLEPLNVLVGEWSTVGKHPLVPGVELQGHATIEWVEGGAFLRVHAAIDHPDFPTGIAIIGSDNASQQMYMLYFDSREVSRKYDFSMEGNQWKWWRDDPEFSQRFSVQIEDGGEKMVGRGEMRKAGGDWEDDLDLTYTRIK